ncbi:MAG: transcriptional regulator [Thermoplasmata archaeon]|nr:MAG: transcriptional regulator [Thermoplasmata archaeon]
MIEIESGSLEARVIKVLLKTYPITTDELRDKLGISEKKLVRVLKGLASRGFISFDELPDKTYIRLNRLDFQFIGHKETQKKALKHVKEKKRKYKRVGDQNSDEMMYR